MAVTAGATRPDTGFIAWPWLQERPLLLLLLLCRRPAPHLLPGLVVQEGDLLSGARAEGGQGGPDVVLVELEHDRLILPLGVFVVDGDVVVTGLLEEGERREQDRGGDAVPHLLPVLDLAHAAPRDREAGVLQGGLVLDVDGRLRPLLDRRDGAPDVQGLSLADGEGGQASPAHQHQHQRRRPSHSASSYGTTRPGTYT